MPMRKIVATIAEKTAPLIYMMVDLRILMYFGDVTYTFMI